MPPTKTASTPVEETPQVTESKPKTYTNWKAFEQAKMVPTSIKCEGYRPVFQHDASCHTNLKFDSQTLIRHIQGDHGGGFRFFLKQGDKISPLWADLAEAGLEAHDFRCEICDRILRFHPASFLVHQKAHAGKTRRVLPGGAYNLTLSLAKPEEILDSEEDA